MFKVIGKGLVCREPELRFLPTNGKAVCNVTFVNNDEYNGEKTGHFTKAVLWGDEAVKFAEICKKGALVDIKNAILKHPVHEYKGKKIYNTEIVILEWEFIKQY